MEHDFLMEYIETEKVDYIKKIETLQNYMYMKMESEDDHGVSDAANDIRELKSIVKFIDRLLEQVNE